MDVLQRYLVPSFGDREGAVVADEILAALRAAGYAVVPVEPTEEMVKAPSRGAAPNTMRAIYRTMIAAIDTPGGDGVE